MAAPVTKDELGAALSKMKETIVEHVNRELEQRMKTEDFQQVFGVGRRPDAGVVEAAGVRQDKSQGKDGRVRG